MTIAYTITDDLDEVIEYWVVLGTLVIAGPFANEWQAQRYIYLHNN